MQNATRAQLKRLGATIRAGRLAMGFSQEDFAERCEVHRTYMGHVERGETNISYENLARVAKALRVKPSALLDAAGL